MPVITGDAEPPRRIPSGAVQLTGFRAFWYVKAMGNPVIFHVFAWFGCSVPITRGRLKWLTVPRDLRR